jgi:hypothetical protein
MNTKQRSDQRKKRRRRNRPVYGVDFRRKVISPETFAGESFGLIVKYPTGYYWEATYPKTRLAGPYPTKLDAERGRHTIMRQLANSSRKHRESSYNSLSRAMHVVGDLDKEKKAIITIRKRKRKGKTISAAVL